MGIYPRSDLHRPSASPDTPPPEVESPKPHLFSFRPKQGRAPQLPAPISPPMSSYDMSITPGMLTGNGTEDRHRGDASRGGQQQQQQQQQQQEQQQQQQQQRRQQPPSQQLLPSLSSIFGPPSQMRPLQSPMSDRPSPLYSPLERPQSAAANPDRPQPQSYFPPVTSAQVVQPRTVLEPRLSGGRISLPSAGSLFPGPLSPRGREFDQPQHRPRESSVPNAPWSASGHPEYVFGSHTSQEPSSTFRPVNNLGHGPSHEPIRGPRDSVVSGYASASSTVVSEGAPGKDSLGPKIWTGTHFLPRFVRQAEYPGEGLCYFYDDGTHCKTVIDGEPVNAHWGVTKAGKPRKRLAIACLTCREKKIKCDPDFPRCVQCEKFGRVCKFKNAPRGGHNPSSPVTSPGGHHEETRSGGPQARAGEPGRQRSMSSTSVSPRTTAIPHHSPEMPGLPSKRMRVDYDHYRPTARDELRFFEAPENPDPSLSWQKRDLPRIHEDLLCRAWQTNPYVSDPQAISTAIASFFDHVETAALRFLPAQLFRDWVQNNAHTKSPEDLMLLYSISAFGLYASGGSRRLAHEYAETARFACERSAPSLQLVQTKLVLSLYYLAYARGLDSYEHLGSAISIALALQFNVEPDATSEAAPPSYPYNMNRATYDECRRRTFFSCFVLERTNGLFPSRSALIRAEDVFLRLPCDEALFDDDMDTPSETPMFSVAREVPSSDAGVGILGYLVNIVEVLGRVLAGVQQEARGSAPVDADARFIERIGERLRQYQDALPPKFRFSDPNLARATDEGVDGSLITLHLVLLLTRTKFARHAQSEVARTLQAESISQKCTMLAGDLMFATTALRDQLVERRDTAEPFLPTTFAVHAAAEAIDILTASGTASSVSASIQEVTAARELCDSICSVWQCAKLQKKALDERAEALHLLRSGRAGEAESGTATAIPGCQVSQPSDSGPLQFRFLEPLEKRFPVRLDAIYGSRAPLRA